MARDGTRGVPDLALALEALMGLPRSFEAGERGRWNEWPPGDGGTGGWPFCEIDVRVSGR